MSKTSCTGGQEENNLKWWQLSLIGVGCIIGTGYFLGSGLAIKMTGPSIIISFILAAFGTYLVFDVLAKMTASDPQKGSFCAYAKNAYGRWAGFSCGWVYWCSEILIIGSQLTALSIFSRFWFPDIPLWVFAAGYAVLGLLVILAGTKGFERIENLFAVIKVSAILMFLIIAALALFGVLDGGKPDLKIPDAGDEFFPKGLKGFWSSLIYAFYAFGGIEIMALMAINLQRKEDAPKSGKVMLLLLTIIYVLSIGLAVTMVSWRSFNAEESPFVIALDKYDLPFFPHVFNGALIIAGFSTMAASLFAVTSLLVTLAEGGDAPSFFAKKGKKEKAKEKPPLAAVGLTTAGLAASVILALLIPGKIYEYMTTAAGLMLLYNWFFILLSSGRLLQLTGWGKVKRILGMILIALAVSGTLWQKTSRPGFWMSLLFVVIIGLVVLMMRTKWKKGEGQKGILAIKTLGR
ncbi:amino acid permease [Bacillus songklensis]|uniref:Amino acid permease n=1 Tax=Bacillus songklensis TaxID=1069116 RepID=A0ABV8B4C8_9BACI